MTIFYFCLGGIFFLYCLEDIGLYVTLFAVCHSVMLLLGVLTEISINAYLIDAIIPDRQGRAGGDHPLCGVRELYSEPFLETGTQCRLQHVQIDGIARDV